MAKLSLKYRLKLAFCLFDVNMRGIADAKKEMNEHFENVKIIVKRNTTRLSIF